MVLGKLPGGGRERPTNFYSSRARAYCACSRCGWVIWTFFSHLSILFHLPLSGKRPINRLKYCLKGPLPRPPLPPPPPPTTPPPPPQKRSIFTYLIWVPIKPNCAGANLSFLDFDISTETFCSSYFDFNTSRYGKCIISGYPVYHVEILRYFKTITVNRHIMFKAIF